MKLPSINLFHRECAAPRTRFGGTAPVLPACQHFTYRFWTSGVDVSVVTKVSNVAVTGNTVWIPETACKSLGWRQLAGRPREPLLKGLPWPVVFS